MNILSKTEIGGFHTKIHQLQRTNDKLVQMNQKLHSYTYEPYTEHLFLKSIALKDTLGTLRQRNDKIIEAANKASIQVLSNLNASVKQQLSDFEDLRNEFMEYSAILNKSHLIS